MVISTNRGKNSKILASVITMSVIAMLIIASPAYAWQVTLQSYDNDTPIQGEIITAKFNLNLQSEINLAFDRIIVSLDGPESANCYFDIHGKFIGGNDGKTPGNPPPVNHTKVISISPGNASKIKFIPGNPGNESTVEICKQMSIKAIPLEEYGYGYGYEHFTYEGNETALMVTGDMPYLLTLNTSVLDLGEYKSKVTLTLGGKKAEEHISEKQTFTVINKIKQDDNQDPPSTGGRFRHNESKNESADVQLSDIINANDETTAPKAPENPGFFSRITGAVIGTLGKTGTTIIAIVILALVAGTAALQARRRFFVAAAAAGATATATSTGSAAKIAAQ